MIMIRDLLEHAKGATAIEYGLIAALIAVSVITVLGTVGDELIKPYTLVEESIARS